MIMKNTAAPSNCFHWHFFRARGFDCACHIHGCSRYEGSSRHTRSSQCASARPERCAARGCSERQHPPRHGPANRQRFARGACLYESNVDPLGASTVFSFGEGARRFDLVGLAASCCKCTEEFRRRANQYPAVATVAGTSFTAMTEHHPKSGSKFMILKGGGSVSLNHHPGETLIAAHRADDSCAPGCDQDIGAAGCRSFQVD